MEDRDLKVEGTQAEKSKKDKNDKSSGLMTFFYCVVALLIMFVYVFLMNIVKDNYGKSLNMWWMVLYTVMSQLWNHFTIVFIGGLAVYIAFSINWKGGVVATIILMAYLIIASPDCMKEYDIEGERQSFGDVMINQLKDIVSDEYEIINVSECEILKDVVRKRGKRRTRRKEYYYLKIDGGKYVIPLTANDKNSILTILNFKGIKEIKVHKHTKYIVEIDGIKVNELTKGTVDNMKEQYEMDAFNELVKNCELVVNTDNTINVKLGDDIDSEDLCISTFGPDKVMFSSLGYDALRQYSMTTYEDGTWCIFVTNSRFECMSNIILYEVRNGEIKNIRNGTYDLLDEYLPPKHKQYY